ncbi:zinc-binding dehydrogenase [Bacillus cereus]
MKIFVEKVNELTNGEGVDVILDSISGTVSERSLKCLAYYGRLIHFGNASGEIGNFQTKDLHASCRSILGFSFGTTRKNVLNYSKKLQMKFSVICVTDVLQIKATKSFPLQDAGKAHEWVESRKSTGKVILTVQSSS